MKITLISPYPDIQAFGIRSLSACLKDAGYHVQLIFLPKRFTEKYEEKTLHRIVELSKRADLIGISLMTNFFDNVVQITRRLKETLSIPILWGGIHPTLRPEECLNYADMVCIGEGEESLVELAGKIRDEQDYHNIEGMWFKDKGRRIRNQMRPLIQDLDSIPFPDYDHQTHYILTDGTISRMDIHLLEKHMDGTYMTMCTRGCPFSCTYCCNNALNKMYPNQPIIRKRGADSIIRELVEAKSRFPFVRTIKFDDDAFFVQSVEEIRLFCKKFKDTVGLRLYVTGATPTTLTDEKLRLLVDAGLTNIRVGIQTGSKRTKGLYKRHYSNQQVEQVAKQINGFKDKIRSPEYDIILDNPWETDEDLTETLMLLTKLPTPCILYFYSLTFYPETELYRKARRDGIITNDLKEVYRKYYHGCRDTYLNRLFFLLKEYARTGDAISPGLMSLLTNRNLRRSRLGWLLCVIMKLRYRIRYLRYLLQEGLRDVRRGDWTRIVRHIRSFGNVEKPVRSGEGGQLDT